MEAKSEVRVKEEKKCNGDYLLFQNPCIYFQEFMRAMLKCLGFTPSNTDDEADAGAGGTTQLQPDPPASPAADPPAAELSRLSPPRAPPRPPISGGGPPQTNTNPN